AVAMLIVPAMFAAQLSTRLPVRLVLTVGHSVISAVLGYHLSIWLKCSAAGAMVVCGSLLFALAWAVTALLARRAASSPEPENSGLQSAATLPG
ncbi:MAG: metal ABC transporter permease, partial [Terrimicrobiaceae bacterium]